MAASGRGELMEAKLHFQDVARGRTDAVASDISEPLIEITGQQWHTAPHESVRYPNNATRTSKATSAFDTDAVG